MKIPMGVKNDALLSALMVAQQIEKQPDVGLTADEARRHIKSLADAINTSACFRNAVLKGMETFCLSSGDKLAPLAIERWAHNALAIGSTSKGEDALKIARRWESLDYARIPT